MRINILQAGLVTYLMAGKGFLPQDDTEPKYGSEPKHTDVAIPPVQLKPLPVAKEDKH